MKKLMTMLLGMSLALGSVAMFAQDTKKAPAKTSKAKATKAKATKAKSTKAAAPKK